MTDQIKCRRVTYDLQNGDTIMDNGACYQLITRSISKGFHSYRPLVSKKAFTEFIKNPYVKINTDHEYDNSVTLYIYYKDN